MKKIIHLGPVGLFHIYPTMQVQLNVWKISIFMQINTDFIDHLKQKMRLLLEISIFQMAVKIKNNEKGISNTPASFIFNIDTFYTNSYHLLTKTWPKFSVFIAMSYCLPQIAHCVDILPLDPNLPSIPLSLPVSWSACQVQMEMRSSC